MSSDEHSHTLRVELRSIAEETANMITHGLGFLLSLVAAVVLMTTVVLHGDTWRIVGCGLYATSLVLVYLMSTLSHSFTQAHRRRFYRILDQGCIYLLIVGTYTPFALAYLRTVPWLAFLGLMWAIALTGFFSKVLYAHRVEKVSIIACLVLGWMPVISAPTLMGLADPTGLWWMLFGGLCYTVGTVFLVLDYLRIYFHAVWHLFVIAGSTWHFLAILVYVAPVK